MNICISTINHYCFFHLLQKCSQILDTFSFSYPVYFGVTKGWFSVSAGIWKSGGGSSPAAAVLHSS